MPDPGPDNAENDIWCGSCQNTGMIDSDGYCGNCELGSALAAAFNRGALSTFMPHRNDAERIAELEEQLAVTGERLDKAANILRDLLYNWEDWSIARIRKGPFSPPIGATKAWLKALEKEQN